MEGMEDDPTFRFYAENAAIYAARTSASSRFRLDRFLLKLKPGAEILELGCGNGRDSALMIERGFRVTPTDGTPEMAGEAEKRLGVPVRVLRFEDIDAVDAFDGVWANACLLHVPRSDLGAILAGIHSALRSGGIFYASFKAGAAEGFDDLGRYYNYPSREWLNAVYETRHWTSIDIDETHGGAYDDRPTDWLHVTAVKG
ncbi:class I SAM-dependent methyltransferase [Neorhizobium petrolearium]|uniref:Class I SAM-dependent methyltransferase n=1 Tax=Neorhizobium petrolearium TaxID=515361 RepID=A0ABY8M4E9_9HYPH|nr:class I SAM-dependent methyltransferase [Neorhizobium petrolearium]MCC2608239.1 class I SAM-dependent methyltransferase [Neorhizobium petrolearium]WGI68524.1 class I SAM-dependent methyltransferase [Neorhizobium petrolearium]